MDQSINSISNNSPFNTSIPSTNAQHYLADIKYPNIPDFISLEKIFNVLEKIRTTSRPLTYKWQSLTQPKHGEIFLEQKYPLTRDPILGDQFPIVDDGYLWSSIPKPEIRQFQGQHVEIYRWTEGFTPGDQFFTMSKTEYRLKTPNNILFLIHYLKINQNIPIKTALPATKISVLYLQQQFFQHLKQQMAQMNYSQRSPSPASGRPTRPLDVPVPLVRPPQVMPSVQRTVPVSTTKASANNTQTVPVINDVMTESTMDIFDSFGDYQAAHYRFNVLKSLLKFLFESPAQRNFPSSSSISIDSEGLEADLVAAVKKKISVITERTEKYAKTRKESLQAHKLNRKNFWSLYNELDRINNDQDFDELHKKFTDQNIHMDIDNGDEEVIYTFL